MKLCPECGEVLLDVKRLELKPGDMLYIVRPEGSLPLSPKAREQIGRTLGAHFPENKVVICEDGMTPIVEAKKSP